ncbi:MAG: CCA tRNA nucleotidyltransferase [Anaerolineae bacterium]
MIDLSAAPTLDRLLPMLCETAMDIHLDVYLVGGVIRDLLLRRSTVDFDFAVEGDAIEFTRELAARHGGTLTMHPTFRTATWSYQELEIDFATARTETYPEPAMLPVVTPASIDLDLYRRDFTINALALRLNEPRQLIDLYGGQEDLRSGIIRVLHDHSFIDDPTRLFRAVRFEQRLNFHIEPHTFSLIAPALPYISRLSGERLRYEFELIFSEDEPEKSLHRLHDLGLLTYLDSGLIFDETLYNAFRSYRLLAADQQYAQNSWHIKTNSAINIGWALLGSRTRDPEQMARRLMLDRTATLAVHGGQRIAKLLDKVASAQKPSEVDALLNDLPTEVLVAGSVLASGDTRAKVTAYATTWRYVTPLLSGKDFTNWGLSPGPLFGKLLRGLRTARLDGQISSLEQEREFVQRVIAQMAADDATGEDA